MIVATTLDPLTADPLDRAIATLQWRILGTSRDHLLVGQPVYRRHVASGYVYVSTGRVRMSRSDGPGLDLDAGDLVFFPRAHATVFVALENAELLDVAFAPSPQRQLVADTMPELLYVRDEAGCAPSRWLHRVGDPYITAVLDAIHAEPGQTWTLGDLASIAAMSRSAFAERFRDVVGHTPRAYLFTVRMETAKGLMLAGEISVAELAGALGYTSEDGFSRAFHRYAGSAPGRWRTEAKQSHERVSEAALTRGS